MKFVSNPNQDLSQPGREHIPPAYKNSLLPGSEREFLAKTYGHIFSQYIRDPAFEIWQHDFYAQEEQEVQPIVTQGILTLHFMVQKNIDFYLHGKGRGTMQEGWHILFYVSAGPVHRAWLPMGHSRSLHFDLSISLLEDLAGRFVELQPLVHHAKEGVSQGIHQKPVRTDAAAMKILEEIYQHPSGPQALSFYKAAISILLLFYARDLSGYSRKPFTVGRFIFSPEDIDKLYRARDIVLASSEGSPVRISTLSRQVAMNTSKLKAGFHELFRATIFDFQHSRRMTKAKELLLTSASLSEIAYSLEYASAKSFVFAFTNYFNFSPAVWRKNGTHG